METKVIKQGDYNFLSVNNTIVCAFNETKNQFVRCSTANITEKVIGAINYFRSLYDLKEISMEYFIKEFS